MVDKQMRQMIERARKAGYVYLGLRNNGHPHLRWEDGTTVTIPATPSDTRGIRNAVSQLERTAGKRLPDGKHTPKKHRDKKTSGPCS